jgi:hypothetical protein
VGPGLLCVTVDLDPLDAYHAIHGLPPAPADLRDHLSAVAIPRFLALFARLGLPGTFFAVGSDLASERVAALMRQAVAAGHEVGNHTATHPYGFLDLAAPARAAELDRGHEAVLRATGVAPVGFRAPGYYVDRTTLGLLSERGYCYDSSMLPSLPYYAAKLGVMGLLRLRGRRSRSRLHPPLCLLAPTAPYRPDATRPWRRGSAPLVELPAASLVAGVPLVGTFLGDLPRAAVGLLAGWLSRRPFVSVEFHAIDLVAPDDGGLDALRGRQVGLQVPVARRRRRFEALLAALAGRAEPVTLAQAAGRVTFS